jgi:hypothetical protein
MASRVSNEVGKTDALEHDLLALCIRVLFDVTRGPRCSRGRFGSRDPAFTKRRDERGKTA